MKCFGSVEKKRAHHCKIVLLDETELIQEIQDSFRGHDILDVVFKHLNLLETAYFGLRYINSNHQPCWLDANKNVIKQMKGVNPITLYFGVKFYASDPCKLLEEITRYQFFLQLKQDILQLRLPVSYDLAAELLSFSVQSELGDYDSRHHESGYVSEFRLLPSQTTEFEKKVEDLHKDLIGQVPATAELNFLDRVKWLELYGADLHPVLGEDNVEYFLGIAPSGVIVLRNKTRVGNYFWPRIVKIFRKGKYFMLRVIDKSNEENTYGFELPNKDACKHLWKCCCEHQDFFKLTQSPLHNNNKIGFPNRLRRSNRSDRSINKENNANTNYNFVERPAPSVVRVPSRRYQRRLGQPDGADAGSISKEEAFKENGYIEVKSSIMKPNLGRHNSSPVIYQPSSVVHHNVNGISMNGMHFHSNRGLFSNGTNPSPRSVRSASFIPPHFNSASQFDGSHSRRNSSSSLTRIRNSSKISDNESEVSRCSRSSRHSRHSQHRCRHKKSDESGTDSDSSRKRHRRRHKHHNERNSQKLIDSESQWKAAQLKQETNYIGSAYSLPRPQNAVVRHVSGYVNSGMESDTQESTLNRIKRKQRSRSKSPEVTRRDRLANELRKHIEYNLVDPIALTDHEKKDIKYTKVETDARLFKIRYSPLLGRQRFRISPGMGDIVNGDKSNGLSYDPRTTQKNVNNNNSQDSNTSISTVSSKIADSDNSNHLYSSKYFNGSNASSHLTFSLNRPSQRLSDDIKQSSFDSNCMKSHRIDQTRNYNYEQRVNNSQNTAAEDTSPVPTPRVKFQSPPAYYSSEVYKKNVSNNGYDGFRGNAFHQSNEMSTEL